MVIVVIHGNVIHFSYVAFLKILISSKNFVKISANVEYIFVSLHVSRCLIIISGIIRSSSLLTIRASSGVGGFVSFICSICTNFVICLVL